MDINKIHSDITEILVFSIYRYAYSNYAKTANKISELNEEAKYRYLTDDFFHNAVNTITAQIIDRIQKGQSKEGL